MFLIFYRAATAFCFALLSVLLKLAVDEVQV